MLTQMTFQGYTFRYLWPGSPLFEVQSIQLLSIFVGFASVQFLRVFLQTKILAPKIDRLFIGAYGLYVIATILVLSGFLLASWILILSIVSPLSMLMLFTAIRIARTGYRPAIYFSVAWSFFLVGVFIYAMKDFGILPHNNFTVYTMPVGSAIETVLLSFALADKINILKKEKEISQAETMELLKEKERIVLEQNIVLERKVRERTAELEASNRSLKEAEAHLVNVEKMASLGQLTAGISHEINNPINFVVSNIKPLKRDIDDVMELIDKYNDIKDENGLAEKLAEISDLKKKIDLDYLIQEVNLLLKGIDEGARRTSEIVKGLKNFSRTDEAVFKKANIHDGIDATLSILNNGIVGANIKVVKNYGKVPEIECYPGKLNQVFMNLLNNAIHAVLAAGKVMGDGEININTSFVDDNVIISIKDNGTGIPKTHLNKIFEPFFTTKPVGMGTGLGLSIVYGIINSHNGQIDIRSEEGKGAEFIITLPVKH
jgi:signal transduction histidine kinase